ncbi:unnamed protein product [Brassicogethes aeneus]|uniref:3-hydroxyisobutyrate dehydrogenase n=1 Tax=Brassicogethes aeneus TaxID=1431903 RepID=A0A9P0AWD8_BRAAE|nr:unnamed protein product [Brassicogethes aeneus]
MLIQKNMRLLAKFESLFQKRNASKISFIGLGQMGSKMARNLIKKGNTVKVFDVIPEARNSIEGAQPCDSLQQVVEGCDVIITMLPNGRIVKEITLGQRGVLEHLEKGAVLVDCSTIEHQCAVDVNEAVLKRGGKFLDAPVSGGITGAEAGTLTFMVGGDETTVKTVEPTLLQMGQKVYHCGQTGSGQIAKMCNNLILGVTMIGTCEAMNLARKLGLDQKKLTEIVNASTGKSWSSEIYNPVPGILPNVPSSNGYKGGFAVPLMAKDLGIADSAALACGAAVPLTAAALQIYRMMQNHGFEQKDFSSVYEFLKGKNSK